MDSTVMPLQHVSHDDVTVRWGEPRDTQAIRRVAERDSRRMPHGAMLVAEVDGEILAARAIDGEETIADPFRPTNDLVDLLELRAAQVAAHGQDKGRGVAALWLARTLLAGRRGQAEGDAASGLGGAVAGRLSVHRVKCG